MIPGIVAGHPIAAGPPPAIAEYWNPLDRNVGIELSEAGNRLASGPSGSQWRSVRSVTSHTSGKMYAEMVYVAGAVVAWQVFGVATLALPLDNNVGSSATSWGLQTGGAGARLLNNGASLGSVAEVTIGSYVRVAIDFDSGEGWIGNASDYVLGGNPSTGDTASFTFPPGTRLFLAASLNGDVGKVRLRTAPGDFEGGMPSGFGPWL